MVKICFIAHFAFGALVGGRNGHFGGVERQTSLMSRWFAGQGYKVSFLTWDEGPDTEREVGGVQIIKMCRRDAGLPGFRFFSPRWASLNRAMRRADADLYYQNCGEYVTGQAAWWCRRHKRKFIYSVASDPECDPKLPEMNTFRERLLYRQGIRRADRIIVQSHRQKQMLQSGFGLDAVVLPMPCPGPAPGSHLRASPPVDGRGRVLWVGRFSRTKRLEMLLKTAAALPQIQFDVAGGPDREDDYSASLRSTAKGLRNISLLGQIPREKMKELYLQASLLCCTSIYEGFPNTFLEAWSYGLPIVSTVDPDDLLFKRNLGLVAADSREMTSGISHLLGERDRWREISNSASRYYLTHHAVEPAMAGFENTFLEVLGLDHPINPPAPTAARES
jgi:glycosyltransferase involved in cell wall biosynthesis